MLCEMSAELFKIACLRGYDSKDFIYKLMKSEEGKLLYSDKCIDMWLGANHVMLGIEVEITVDKGEVINPEVMAWIGYLFKCWSLTYPNENSEDILRQASFETLTGSYMGFHVMSYEDAILNFKEIYEETKK
ncbi:MAG: hypothetical protein J6A92_02225 [Lachnospiraceae bacterium]|nr:hypothetical protein [Lachnospiraceae bacterium]